MITENQKKVLAALAGKTFWSREEAELKCAGIYSNEGELVKGFRVLYKAGFLGANMDGRLKIIGVWLTEAGERLVKSFEIVKVHRFENPCKTDLKICYHTNKCYLSYKCDAARTA